MARGIDGDGAVTDRWVPVRGAANMRDLGGLPASDGVVRRGLVLRSDNLQDLTAADVQLLVGRTGLGAVLDLRTDGERRAEGPGPLRRLGLPHHDLTFVRDAGADGILPEGDRRETSEIYLSYLTDAPDSIVDAVGIIADAEAPVLFHCAAGKDRTGVLAALLLCVLGVPRVGIVADYLASNDVVPAVVERLLRSPTYRHRVARVPLEGHLLRPSVIQRFLDGVDERYGSPASFLETAGLPPAALRRLGERLVTPAAAVTGR